MKCFAPSWKIFLGCFGCGTNFATFLSMLPLLMYVLVHSRCEPERLTLHPPPPAGIQAKCIETLLLRMKQSHNTFRLMEACNCYGNNPLHCAAAFGCAEAVEVLLGYASREEQDTCSPLLCSRICASANRMGDTPLLTAARYANWNTLVAVVSAGFSNSWELAVHQRNSLSGDSIIHAACCGAGWCNEDDSSASLLRRLVDTLKRELAPASLSNLLQSTNFRDQTALHVAEQWPNIAASVSARKYLSE